MTFEEHRGPIRDRTLAWIGDGNNVADLAGPRRAAVRLRAAPRLPRRSWRPTPRVLAWAAERQARVQLFEDPREAVAGRRCGV